MKYAVIMIPLLLLSSIPAYAEWVEIGISTSSVPFTVYVDPDTRRRKGNLVKMWMLFDHPTAQTSGTRKPFSSSKIQSQFDCEEERSRFLAWTNFSGHMGKGDVVISNSNETKWNPVQPESLDEVLWRLACGKQ